MRRTTLVLVLCVLSMENVAVGASARPPQLQPAAAAAAGARHTRAADHWLALISEIARIGATSEQAHSSGSATVDVAAAINNLLTRSPVRVSETEVTGAGGVGGGPTLRVLVLPVPVLVAVPVSQFKSSFLDSSTAPNIAKLLASLGTSPVITHIPEYKLNSQKTSESPSRPSVSIAQVAPPPLPASAPADQYLPVSAPSRSALAPPLDSTERPAPQERRARHAIMFPPVEDSQKLLQQFHEQTPRSPSLPPVVTDPQTLNSADEEVADVPDPADIVNRPLQAPATPPPGAEQCGPACAQPGRHGAELPVPPPPPRFERTMMLEAVLTVPRADYSEPYTLWWDAASGASRMEHHEGTASTYRLMRIDGRVQSVHVRVERSGDADVRRCVVARPRRVTLAERALPVLPDLTGFSFAGYVEMGGGTTGGAGEARVERWERAVEGGGGGARGEELHYRHELLVARAADALSVTPLRYAVAVDSSVLGANADAYVHRFYKVHTRHYDAATFSFDVGDACDNVEHVDDIRLAEPLREFAMLQRDPMYDDVFDRFKRQYDRRYADDLEDAVRKNVLIQSSRLVSSGNRKGASFELDANFLADRLKVELNPLHGIEVSSSDEGTAFPYSKVELRRMRGRLPQKFDWRERGGVTPVRNQSLCAACWAFSVVGAVEGALFSSTGRLVPLSEQSLVDCGHRTGAKGCSPTWPNFGYNYVRDYGLPALDEYNPYVGKVQQCEAERVAPVTRIGGHVNVTAKDLLALKVAIRRHGPTVVLVDGTADSLYTYKGGFYHDAKCKKESSNHAMLAVGWTVHRGETYFILKNSWTAGWGRGGYVYMRGRTNTCGVLRRPSLPLLRPAHVLRVPAGAPAAAATPIDT